MSSESDDPTAVHTIVVTAEDVLAAFEAGRQTGRRAVLRATPPFSSRMRARLHVADAVPAEAAAADADPEQEGVAPVAIPPAKLLDDAPAYPHPDDTEDELRADPDAAYTRDRHRERHEAALEDWREAARRSIADSAVVETSTGPHEVEVAVLDSGGV